MPAPKFNIEFTDGSVEEVKLLPKAQLRYEDKTGKSLGGDSFGESVGDLYRLAWFAAGEPEGSLEKWIENVEAVTGVDAPEEPVDPTSTDILPD